MEMGESKSKEVVNREWSVSKQVKITKKQKIGKIQIKAGCKLKRAANQEKEK